MDIKRTTAGISALTALTMGTVDATTLKEQPIERLEIIANERIEARQIGNIVETKLPWKGEDGITLKVDLGEPTTKEKLMDKRKREVITETVDFGEGGFKVDILLNERPDTNRFCYEIEGAENYDFFYQPPLTLEEIKEGAKRPENIVGSYAVYHKTLKNHRTGGVNYATGKVMHIPRPQVWELNDEENTKEWAELSYTEGQLCVTVSNDWLAKANYPVRVDPTFGYTSVGASSYANTGNRSTVVDTYTATAGDTIVSYSLAGDGNVSPWYSVVAYEFNGTDPTVPIVTGGVPIAPTSSSRQFWSSSTVSHSLVGGTTYVLAAVKTDTTFTARAAYDTAGGGNLKIDGRSTILPNPWSTSATISSYRTSIYATYTASGGGGPANGIAVPAVITY